MIEKCKGCGQEIEVDKGDKIKFCIGGHTHVTLKEFDNRRKRQQND
jgi:hypothetical protein